MAGQNDFLIFDENNENILTQANYESDTDRVNGFRTGLARSIVTNKVLHQTSMVCHALGELAKDNDQVATDTGNVSELKTALKNALGGADINLSNLSSTGQAKFDAKVSKSGDTMSGALSFTKIGGGVIALNAIPESGYSDIQYTRTDGLRVGFVRANNVSATERNLQISVCNNSGSPTSNLILRCNNDVNSCTFPNTTCCDGQWVDSFHTLSTSTAQGNYEINVSSFLPSDRTNYDYEIMVHFSGFRNSGDTNTYVYISKSAVNITTETDWASNDIYGSANFDGNHGEAGSISCIVIARKNNDKFYLNIARANLTNCALIMTKYRRIGTNA